MKNTSILAIVLYTLSTLVMAQTRSGQAETAGAKPQDATCAFSFKTGTGRNHTTFCVTANGNIAEFGIAVSPAIEFINSPNPVSEGYAFCDATSATNLVGYYDYANTDSGNWNPAVATLKNPKTVVVTRTTVDGNWSLTQTIRQVPATANGYGAAEITMALTNLSKRKRFAILHRHVDVNVGGTFNDFLNTEFSTMATVHGNFGFLTTSGIEKHLGDYSLSFNQDIPDGPVICSPDEHVVQGFFQGDGSSEQRFGLSIAAGETKIGTVLYKPI